MNTTLKVVGGVLLGAAIGAGIGLMVAPTRGDKLQGMLKKKSKKYSKQAHCLTLFLLSYTPHKIQ